MEVILLCLHMLYFIGNLQRWLLRPWQTYFFFFFLEPRLNLKKKKKNSLLRRNTPYYYFLVLQTSGKGVIH